VEYYRTYLDPKTLARIKALEIKARQVIEGLVAGSHKSPYQGMSVEFVEHREYVAGDDVRHIDWKVFGRTDKYYLKEYEQETNLIANLVLDVSESMRYASAETTKLFYASQMAASLAYLVLQQQDSIGLALFDHELRRLIHPSGNPSHLKQILYLLAECEPTSTPSRIGIVLDELAERLTKRSLVIILSDGFDDVRQIATGLKHLRHKRHEVILFHILDPAELEFPFLELTRFRGLEQVSQIQVEPRALRRSYQESFGKYLKELQVACRSAGVDYQRVRTDQPLEVFLTRYLSARAARATAAGR
jgi:uncharacterized protein (DUF58 family)